MASVIVDVKYDEGLVKGIQELFIHKIVPENFLIAIHKYDSNVLTMADIQRFRKMVDSKSSLEVNYDVLFTMKNYRGWFNVILDVCQDSEVKQAHLVDAFKELKSKFDKTWFFHHPQEDNLVSKLENLSLDTKNELEADGGAVCSPPARKSDMVNASGSSMDDQNGAKVGWKMNNGKGYCYACCVDLTSEKFKDGHIAGRNHQKKMKEKGFISFDEARSVEETGEKGFNSSFDAAMSVEETVAASDSFSEDWIKSCQICNLQLTSAQHSRQHMDGSKHKKKVEATLKVNTPKPTPTLGPNGEVSAVNELGVGMCYLCGVSITSKENENLHLNGKKHKNMCKENGFE